MLKMKAYVPSRMLLRALSRPSPPKCHLMRVVPLQYRTAHTKASKTSAKSKSAPKAVAHTKPTPPGYKQYGDEFIKFNKDSIDVSIPGEDKYSIDTSEKSISDEELERDMTDEELMDPDLPEITFYERDLDRGGPDLLVKRIATPQDRARQRDMFKMLKEDQTNPDYDDADLRRALVDDMLVDPRYKEFADVLKGMKERIMSKEEMALALREQEEEEAREALEFEASLKIGGAAARVEELLKDSRLQDFRPHFLEFQKRLEKFDNDIRHPQVKEIMDNIEQELSKRPDLFDEENSIEDYSIKDDMEISEKGEAGGPKTEAKEQVENDDQLLLKMKDVMAAMGGNESVETEIDELLNEKVDPDELEEEPEEEMPEFNFETLSAEISRLNNESKLTSPSGEQIDPELQAKIDDILADPNLLQKLSHLQKLMETAKKRKAAGITTAPHGMAPDPEQLPADRTTGLQQRMEMARNDPEHVAALTSLHVDLPPPFHMSPALKSFNQAIELAYLGANDDIRRILWRAYVKVRTLPTFLHNVSDDTWDLMYYSQAVTWASNQNRQAHLTLLLQDLASVGKNGPPTHPSTFVKD
ncbi:unnamed protein product [Periconia digitata]|uniref:Uncharacterized protein n=1 Tax=Periconia digitata TaxID=1303443 RepID=A0A9W4UT20_9PLEO|nr:unnamed protein product [Periconia digitata]